MKKFLLAVILVVLASGVLIYVTCLHGASRGKKGIKPSSTVRSLVKSGREIGKGAAKAFDSVDFSGKR